MKKLTAQNIIKKELLSLGWQPKDWQFIAVYFRALQSWDIVASKHELKKLVIELEAEPELLV